MSNTKAEIKELLMQVMEKAQTLDNSVMKRIIDKTIGPAINRMWPDKETKLKLRLLKNRKGPIDKALRVKAESSEGGEETKKSKYNDYYVGQRSEKKTKVGAEKVVADKKKKTKTTKVKDVKNVDNDAATNQDGATNDGEDTKLESITFTGLNPEQAKLMAVEEPDKFLYAMVNTKTDELIDLLGFDAIEEFAETEGIKFDKRKNKSNNIYEMQTQLIEKHNLTK